MSIAEAGRNLAGLHPDTAIDVQLLLSITWGPYGEQLRTACSWHH